MEKNKDVGIIGYWFATNYGGVASYYSLYKTVEELGYKPFLVENPYFETDREGYDVFPRHFFKNENMNIAQGYNYENLFQLNKLSDIFLLGSDQVLTTSSIKSFGKLFLMEFAESNKKKIAFSASCGGDNLNSDINLINYAKEQLKDFAAVSVREYSAIDLVKNKFGLFSEMVIDPIFFTSASQYKKLGEKASIKKDEPYLFAYILDPTEDKRKSINTISEHLKINFKIALDGRKFTYEGNFEKMGMPNQTLPELNQYEWFNYFTNASYIITDSFHGAVMAIILNKPFIMYANRGRGYPRFITLAQIFKIYSRLIENSEELTNTDCPEITTTVNRNGQDVTTTFTPEFCVIKTAGDLIDSGFFDSGYLTEDGLDLINDVTDKSTREDTVIIYRRNNRIYSIVDDIKSNEE